MKIFPIELKARIFSVLFWWINSIKCAACLHLAKWNRFLKLIKGLSACAFCIKNSEELGKIFCKIAKTNLFYLCFILNNFLFCSNILQGILEHIQQYFVYVCFICKIEFSANINHSTKIASNFIAHFFNFFNIWFINNFCTR